MRTATGRKRQVRLSLETKAEINRRLQAGEVASALAKEYGTSNETVNRIKRGVRVVTAHGKSTEVPFDYSRGAVAAPRAPRQRTFRSPTLQTPLSQKMAEEANAVIVYAKELTAAAIAVKESLQTYATLMDLVDTQSQAASNLAESLRTLGISKTVLDL